MAATGQWEKVASKGKRHDSKLTKNQKKHLIDAMPRIERKPPVEESKTIYDAFDVEDVKPAKQPRDTLDKQAKDKRNREEKTLKKTPAKSVRAPDKKKLDLAATLRDMDTAELENILGKTQAAFPDNPIVWLKDMASVLNLKLEAIPEPDPVYYKQPPVYPLHLLNEPVKRLLMGVIRRCSDVTLTLFHEHCVQAMVTDMGKGLATYGYRICVQLLAFHRPALLADTLTTYLELVESCKNRPVRVLSVLWAVGQGGVKDLSAGLRAWLGVMLPVLTLRAVSDYVVEYLETLFRLHTDVKPAYNVIDMQQYFPILDLILSSNAVPSHIQKRLALVYPKIKEVAFGAQPEQSLRRFFPSYLVRLNATCAATCSKHLRAELLSCLVTCLRVDPQSFGVWRTMYTKHLTESGVLLAHILATQRKVLNNKELHQTVTSFSAVNSQALQHGLHSKQHTVNQELCQAFLGRRSEKRRPWSLVLFTVFTAVVSLLLCDVYMHGGVKGSWTRAQLQKYGLLIHVETIATQVSLYSRRTALYLQKHVPVWYDSTAALLGPYLQRCWTAVCDVSAWLYAATAPQRAWLSEKAPLVLEWFGEKVPVALQFVEGHVTLAAEWAGWALLAVWAQLAAAGHVISDWLLQNVFTGSLSGENLLLYSRRALEYIQQRGADLTTWVTGLLQKAT